MTARISPLVPPFPQKVQQNFDVIMPKGMPPLGIFKTLGHNPRVLDRMAKGSLLDKGSISIAQRELVILRTCALCKAEYEWGVHVTAFEKMANFTAEQISDTVKPVITDSLWCVEQRLLLEMSDQLHETQTLDQALWGALYEHFDKAQLIELTLLAGLYHAVSFTVNAFQIDLEPFAAKFPH